MGLARDLVELEERIRASGDSNLFAGAGATSILTNPECAALVGRMHSICPAAAVHLCLQALTIQHAELKPKLLDAELVATIPPEIPALARSTERVVHEMLAGAVDEVILLGYELSDVNLLAMLAAASQRGASIIVICDRGRGNLPRIEALWPAQVRRPRMFHDRVRTDAAPYASMHAKCVLVDGRDLLVTSANFTFHGLRGNIEIGVRLGGTPASEARNVFSHLVENGIVEEV